MELSLHNNSALLYNASSKSFFIIIFLWTVNNSDILT